MGNRRVRREKGRKNDPKNASKNEKRCRKGVEAFSASLQKTLEKRSFSQKTTEKRSKNAIRPQRETPNNNIFPLSFHNYARLKKSPWRGGRYRMIDPITK
jgi:hypothetical protein